MMDRYKILKIILGITQVICFLGLHTRIFSRSPKLARVNTSRRRIIIFTDNPDPYNNDLDGRRQVLQRAKDLFDSHICIDVIPTSSGYFDYKQFHQHLMMLNDEQIDAIQTNNSPNQVCCDRRRCIERSIFAVARMKLRINSPCYFVALVPSRNEPGFIVQILPFADDFRDLTDVLKDVAIDVPNDDVLDLMGSVIRKLSFTFDPKQFPNPHIECVQRAIRLIALDKEDNDSFEDRSMPKIDEKVAGPILDKLKTLSAPSRKRKEDSEQSRAKKKK
ncbi:hypothetical protein ACOME3_010493 [Neoechinorhynchus agilis]